ncbi:MAG: penicillin-binding protein 2 [Microthrixaceae bacterium]|nr:penicillin-binding protein 2 [Acidimicrobiales bacterium]MCB9404331.1 penicillin-binding protein 2 [Microthrixaceae bacterium]
MTYVDDGLDEFFGRTRSARPNGDRKASVKGPDRAVSPSPKSARKTTRSTDRQERAPRTVTSRPARLDRAGREVTRPASPVTPPRRSDGAAVRNASAQRSARPAASRSRRRMAPVAVPDGATSRRQTVRRLIWLVVVTVAAAAAVAARLTYTNLAEGTEWRTKGIDQRDGLQEVPAGRGAIFDRRGQPFALSVARPDVVADPSIIEDPLATARTLAPVLDIPVEEIAAKLKGDGRYALVAETVSDATAEKITAIRKAEDKAAKTRGERARTLAGIAFDYRFVRYYPAGGLASAVVGRTVADGGVDDTGHEGLSGIERQFERDLTGEPGRVIYERDASGRPIAGGERQVEPGKPGTDVYLTLDQSLQYESERAITRQVEATGAAAGMVTIMRPSTGEILAMASVASDEDGKAHNTRDNRPVTAVFEPGSVNKVITIAGAIEEGLVEPDTVLDVPDHLQIYDKTFRDHDPHPVRAWSVTDILVTSSNIGTIKLARQLGRENVDRYLRDFGLGQNTQLGFPYEEDGIMLPLEDWSGTSIGAIPIGQGIAVTALQMLSAYNVIANDGVYVPPRLVAATDDGTGRVDTPAAAQRRVVSADTARAVQEMLEKVVTEGTGKRARVPDYPAAGKTGTARIPQGVDASDGYRGADGRYHYQATFLGFISGADLSILVTLEDPQTSTYGGEVAAPVFSQLAAVALLRTQTPPPALLERSESAVPELSSTARSSRDEDAGTVTSTTTG